MQLKLIQTCHKNAMPTPKQPPGNGIHAPNTSFPNP